MRTFILLALFALAFSQATQINDLITGFSAEFGFGSAQIQDGVLCLNTVAAQLAPVVALLHKTKSTDLVASIQGLQTSLMSAAPAVQKACTAFNTDVATYILARGNGQSQVANLVSHGPSFAQAIQSFINNAKAQNFNAAGRNYATIIQILTGATDLPTVQPDAAVMKQIADISLQINQLQRGGARLAANPNNALAFVGTVQQAAQTLVYQLSASSDLSVDLASFKTFLDTLAATLAQ